MLAGVLPDSDTFLVFPWGLIGLLMALFNKLPWSFCDTLQRNMMAQLFTFSLKRFFSIAVKNFSACVTFNFLANGVMNAVWTLCAYAGAVPVRVL